MVFLLQHCYSSIFNPKRTIVLSVEDVNDVCCLALRPRISSVCDAQQDNLTYACVTFTKKQGDGLHQDVRPTEQEPQRKNQEEEEEEQTQIQYSAVRVKICCSPQSVHT